MCATADLSKGPHGDLRLDYSMNGAKVTRLWQPKHGAILETTFKEDGAITLQRVVKGKPLEACLDETIKESGAEGVKESEYSAVKLKKACPSCSKESLVRYADAFRSGFEVPIMPIYLCTSCKSKSYHLTEEYLTHLIKSNPEMFEKEALEQFEKEREKFMAEIKRYIISIFASKKIRRIE